MKPLAFEFNLGLTALPKLDLDPYSEGDMERKYKANSTAICTNAHPAAVQSCVLNFDVSLLALTLIINFYFRARIRYVHANRNMYNRYGIKLVLVWSILIEFELI